jgi:hypothetical protein
MAPWFGTPLPRRRAWLAAALLAWMFVPRWAWLADTRASARLAVAHAYYPQYRCNLDRTIVGCVSAIAAAALSMPLPRPRILRD